MIKINGSYGLGSGQLTRLALIFSTLTQKPLHIINIRSKRPTPGLKPQHLNAVQLLKKICNAKSKGVNAKSTEIKYYPKELLGGKFNIDIKTAGSITLLLQNIIIPLMFCQKPTKLTIIGGTDVSWSPQTDYLINVIKPYFEPYTKRLEIKLIKRGYYPKGNGKIELHLEPKYNSLEQIKKEDRINFTEQNIEIIKGTIHASNHLKSTKVAERILQTTQRTLKDFKTNINIEYSDTLSPGYGITLYTQPTVLGADFLGKKNVKAELIGEQCAKQLLHEINSKAAIDQHMANNLIPILALVKGKIKTSLVTEHTKTAIWICEQFLDIKFTIKNNIIKAD